MGRRGHRAEGAPLHLPAGPAVQVLAEGQHKLALTVEVLQCASELVRWGDSGMACVMAFAYRHPSDGRGGDGGAVDSGPAARRMDPADGTEGNPLLGRAGERISPASRPELRDARLISQLCPRLPTPQSRHTCQPTGWRGSTPRHRKIRGCTVSPWCTSRWNGRSGHIPTRRCPPCVAPSLSGGGNRRPISSQVKSQ
jgi:hypothetical protein